MTRTRNNDFESVLGDLLEQRAGHVTVTPDLEAILTTEAMSTSDAQLVGTGRRHWLLAVAALLACVGVGAAITRNVANQDSITASAGAPIAATSAVPASVASVTRALQDDELIVWLEPGATPDQVRDIAEFLDDAPLATSWSYVDTDQTWAEFNEFWADSPEVLAAVEPGQLPTSFRVRASDPTALVSAIDQAGFPFVKAIDGADIGGACSQRPTCIEIRIEQTMQDLEAQGVTANGSLAILEDRVITDHEADLLRIRLQACIDMVPPDGDGNAFVAGIDNDLDMVPYSGTNQTQLDQFQRCADESVGGLPAIYQLLVQADLDGEPLDITVTTHETPLAD